jgi:hypothetical protein
MGSPQVPDQVKKAPTLALRAFLAGIGKILLERPPGSPSATGPRHAAPRRPATRTVAEAPQASPPRRSLDPTGNVRLLAAEDLDGRVVLAPDGAGADPDGSGATSVAEATVTPAPPQPLVGNVRVGASHVIHTVPLAGYETMSVATIRGRLRTLDVDQLQALLVHEQKNAARPEIIGMIERRILKIESGE